MYFLAKYFWQESTTKKKQKKKNQEIITNASKTLEIRSKFSKIQDF